MTVLCACGVTVPQETVMNVLMIFLADDAQNAAKRKPLVAVARELFQLYFRTIK